MASEWMTRLKETYSLDYRSMAVFRICLGTIVAFDAFLLMKAGDVSFFYADTLGSLPRHMWIEKGPRY